MNIDFGWGDPISLFGFVLIIILIGSVSSYLKVRAQQKTLREAIRAGQPIDPALLGSLERDSGADPRSLRIGGLVTLAVAVALVLFGWQIGRVAGDDEVFGVMIAVAAFPALIGIALLIASTTAKRG